MSDELRERVAKLEARMNGVEKDIMELRNVAGALGDNIAEIKAAIARLQENMKLVKWALPIVLSVISSIITAVIMAVMA